MKQLRCGAEFLAMLIAWTMTFSWFPASVVAHCDSMDGPIVPVAVQALEDGDPTPILRWVAPEYEQEVRDAFVRARGVLEQGGETRAMAQLWFLERLIRLHRAGEGEAYTGLKPAGSIKPVYKKADSALDTGSVQALSDEIASALRAQIEERFDRALEELAHADDSIEAGRSYVAAYVDYMHFVERLDQLLDHHEVAESVETPPRHGH